MILIDTSMWVELLRNGIAQGVVTTGWEELGVVTCGPIIQEVFQGLDAGVDSADFQDAFLALPRLEDPLQVDIFLEAADIYRTGRRQGRTIRSTIDCLIAAIAIRHQARVWHKDRDYTNIASFTKLEEVT